MKTPIILKALKTELEKQQTLLLKVNEMISYNPLDLLGKAIKEFNECKGNIDRKCELADLIDKYTKEIPKRDKKDEYLCRKRYEYEQNIIELKNKIYYEEKRN